MIEVRAGLLPAGASFCCGGGRRGAPPAKEALAGGQNIMSPASPGEIPSPEEKSNCWPELRRVRLSPEQTFRMARMRAEPPADTFPTDNSTIRTNEIHHLL